MYKNSEFWNGTSHSASSRCVRLLCGKAWAYERNHTVNINQGSLQFISSF